MFLNEVSLVGRLTRDPEVRYTQNGVTICDCGFAIAGPEDRETSFVDIVAFKTTAEHLSQWCGKGDELMIRGKLQQDRWQAPDGTSRSKHKVIVFSFMLSHQHKEDTQPEQPQVNAPIVEAAPQPQPANEELPF